MLCVDVLVCACVCVWDVSVVWVGVVEYCIAT